VPEKAPRKRTRGAWIGYPVATLWLLRNSL
jgi:hypothetical protein